MRISTEGLNIYIAKKELDFENIIHVDAIRDICRHRYLFDDIFFTVL